MTRSRASAKAAGTRHETSIVTYLAEHLDDDRIERRSKNGAMNRRCGRVLGRMENAPGSAGNTHRGLTHSSDLSREGLAMNATRTCAHCANALPADTTGRGGRQPNRKFCTTACKTAHNSALRRRPREVRCGYCGKTRTLITRGVAGEMCRTCAAAVASVVAQETNTRDPLDRFLTMTDRDREDGCWHWTGHIQPNGYGSFGVGNRTLRAHRWAYEHYVGPIPDGLQIDHLCRVRHCVNPDHLEPVTAAENTRRALEARA